MLFFAIPVWAQDTVISKKPIDSTYIEKFDDWFVIKPSIVNSMEALNRTCIGSVYQLGRDVFY